MPTPHTTKLNWAALALQEGQELGKNGPGERRQHLHRPEAIENHRAEPAAITFALETAYACTQLTLIPVGPGTEGAKDMNELYREALDCLAKASKLLTKAQELELAGAVYELSLDVATAGSPDVSSWLAQKSQSLFQHVEY